MFTLHKLCILVSNLEMCAFFINLHRTLRLRLLTSQQNKIEPTQDAVAGIIIITIGATQHSLLSPRRAAMSTAAANLCTFLLSCIAFLVQREQPATTSGTNDETSKTSTTKPRKKTEDIERERSLGCLWGKRHIVDAHCHCRLGIRTNGTDVRKKNKKWNRKNGSTSLSMCIAPCTS